MSKTGDFTVLLAGADGVLLTSTTDTVYVSFLRPEVVFGAVLLAMVLFLAGVGFLCWFLFRRKKPVGASP